MKNPTSSPALRTCILSSKILFSIFSVLFFLSANAQMELPADFPNNNGNAQVTFNFQNTNPYPVRITGISSLVSVTGPVGVQAWYNPTPVKNTEAPSITTKNGWLELANATINGMANSSSSKPQSFFSDLSLVIPAGATYGICVAARNDANGYLRYSSLEQGYYTIPFGGCNLITGTNIGWGGAAGSALINNERGFIGTVSFEPIGKSNMISKNGFTTNAPSQISAGVSKAVLMPNLAHNNTTLHFVSDRAMKMEWLLSDAGGNIVMRFGRAVAPGTNDILIHLEDLAAGVYQLTGNSPQGKAISLKLIKQ